MAQTKEQREGKLQERVVAALERHINPNAKIESDVNLPVLEEGVSGKRQFDVLIREGNEPRETLSVVEVQKRKSKVGPDQFNAWLEKMREVGAQHLICVSEKGFTKTVLQRARKHGPTVRLLTLRELEKKGVQSNFEFIANWLENVTYLEASGLQVHFNQLVKQTPPSTPAGPIDPFKKFFETGEGQQLSFNDLADRHFFACGNANISELPKNTDVSVVVNLDCTKSEIFFLLDSEQRIPVTRIIFNIKLRVSQQPINWVASKYEQINFGELVWCLRGRALTETGAEVDVVVTLEEEGVGNYRIGWIQTLNETDVFFHLGQPRSSGQKDPLAKRGVGLRPAKTTAHDLRSPVNVTPGPKVDAERTLHHTEGLPPAKRRRVKRVLEDTDYTLGVLRGTFSQAATKPLA
ncbi:restriction endonuclease [Ruegeria lacuscaerulensis]|uniref:restriction endonuclease n=1 Tax=Ruegeria lacuscaerulensis TaxID=55218 RepID=UPI00147C0D50|nr:restriction endonuclease [Ruegeria lacuscaerulensis]